MNMLTLVRAHQTLLQNFRHWPEQFLGQANIDAEELSGCLPPSPQDVVGAYSNDHEPISTQDILILAQAWAQCPAMTWQASTQRGHQWNVLLQSFESFVAEHSSQDIDLWDSGLCGHELPEALVQSIVGYLWLTSHGSTRL